MIPTEAYPLTWPAGRPRTRWPEHSRFDVTLGKAIKDVSDEVSRMGGSGLIISSNLATRRDGLPYASQGRIDDTGVAVYFKYKGKPMCFACDRWKRVEDNMRAISHTIAALRGIERWGSGSMVEQAFTGFTALPAPTAWWQTLELSGPNAGKADIDVAYRRLSMKHHPDREGGDSNKMAEINRARDIGYEAIAH